MAIYTKTGDDGTTSLASGQRVLKTDVRLEAYGTADELNSFVGLLRGEVEVLAATGVSVVGVDEQLDWVQNRLFDLGAELSEAPGEWITDDDARQLELWIDGMQAELEPLRAFILPGGSVAVAVAHVCRTVTRRLERRMLEMNAGKSAIRTINRLSDYFFVLGRLLAKNAKKPQNAWKSKKNT